MHDKIVRVKHNLFKDYFWFDFRHLDFWFSILDCSIDASSILILRTDDSVSLILLFSERQSFREIGFECIEIAYVIVR